MKKKSFPITNIGTISLMMIFIVLCMVTFAALSLSSAVSDSRSGQKMSVHTEVDGIFSDAYSKAQDAEEYYKMVSEALPDTLTSEKEEGQLQIRYQVDVNDSQAIQVLLAVLSPEQIQREGSGAFYKILSWQEIQTTTWEGDNSIQLIQ